MAINKLMGKRRMVEGKLFRGGAICHCNTPSLYGDPDLIVCLRTEMDQCSWTTSVHVPKPYDLECYATGEERIQQWISLALSGISALCHGERAFVHYRLGRDRTGVVIASILAQIGIPDRAIVREFLLSDGAKEVEIQRALAGISSARGLVSDDEILSLHAHFKA